MMKKIVHAVLTVTLLLFAALNAYLALKDVLQTQKIVAQTTRTSTLQADISSVLKDLTDMETAQRGYLLTGDDSYLQPYTDANARIATDFVKLRTGLAQRPESEQSLQPQIESLAKSKQAEMARSISLRQRGYRHRAFMLVNSNEGQEYMAKARALLSSLSATENGNFETLERERNASARQALTQTIAASSGLFIVAGCLVAFIRRQSLSREREVAEIRQELAQRDLQLAKLTSILSNQARSKTSAMEENARLLLQEYGGFLPRQGHECAEQIMEASLQMERLRLDLVGGSGSVNHGMEAVEFAA
ncbi:MAG TPA: CHASE3 domain-containing protein [Candidatus Sulfotelmatobacter sp.]